MLQAKKINQKLQKKWVKLDLDYEKIVKNHRKWGNNVMKMV